MGLVLKNNAIDIDMENIVEIELREARIRIALERTSRLSLELTVLMLILS